MRQLPLLLLAAALACEPSPPRATAAAPVLDHTPDMAIGAVRNTAPLAAAAPMCDALEGSPIVGQRGRTIRTELYAEWLDVDRYRKAYEAATYTLRGDGWSRELRPSITETRFSLLATADRLTLDPDADVALEIDFGAPYPTCHLSAVWHPVEPPTPIPMQELDQRLRDEGWLMIRATRTGNRSEVRWYAEPTEDPADFDYVEKRCFHRVGAQAIEGPCLMDRDSVALDFVVLDNEHVVRVDELRSYLMHESDGWHADTRRVRYAAIGSVVWFQGWTSDTSFRLGSACCGDTDVYEYDIAQKTRKLVGRHRPADR